MEWIWPAGDPRWFVFPAAWVLLVVVLYWREVWGWLGPRLRPAPGRVRQRTIFGVTFTSGDRVIPAWKAELSVLMLALVLGGAGWWAITSLTEEKVWTHSTLSLYQQNQAKAECEMEALMNGPNNSYLRLKYRDNCLIAKDFERVPRQELPQ